ncbi:MAG: type II toxin-antitoxin system PemK/MazF family toxin [Xenococcaceae cyanobacterium MO_207.B15]|nr:type II toxin-antitoxin system PemK/MazF family toxin [Xenococcaceae cyanobacterium MO_207.B15]
MTNNLSRECEHPRPLNGTGIPARILKKCIYWAKLDPTVGTEQAGTRPVLIVSIDSFNKNSNSAIAFAITSKQPKVSYPLVFELPKNLLPKPSWVKITQIRTLSVQRLGSYIASISDQDFEQIMSGFNRLCGVRSQIS